MSSTAWRVLVNADGEPYAVDNGTERLRVGTDGTIEPRRATSATVCSRCNDTGQAPAIRGSMTVPGETMPCPGCMARKEMAMRARASEASNVAAIVEAAKAITIAAMHHPRDGWTLDPASIEVMRRALGARTEPAKVASEAIRRPLPASALAGVVAFARNTWRDDGAEGEAVHRLCDAVEALSTDYAPVACSHPIEATVDIYREDGGITTWCARCGATHDRPADGWVLPSLRSGAKQKRGAGQ